MARRVTDADVTRFRNVRGRLRAVFEAADSGDHVLAVDLLNSLLMEFPVSPQISGHDYLDDTGRPDWHMHLADHPSNASAGCRRRTRSSRTRSTCCRSFSGSPPAWAVGSTNIRQWSMPD